MGRLDQDQARRVLAHNVRRLRLDRGLSQDELATEADSRQALVSSIEAGTANPTLNSLFKIAAALGVEVGELFAKAPGHK